MKERFKTNSAVILMLMRDGKNGEEVLLQKRKNTGYCDGYYDFSACGHVENHESMTMAICREAKEELSIDIKAEELEFVCMIHKNTTEIYYNGYFKATEWEGTPKINEPEKNEELRWVNIRELPKKMINDRIMAMENYKNNIKYSEFGWNS